MADINVIRSIQESIDNMFTSTWSNIREEKVDNIFKSTPLLEHMNQKGKVKYETGGKYIEINLEYANSKSANAHIGKDHDLTTQIAASKALELFTSIQIDWRYITSTIYRSWTDDQKNRGKSAVFSQVEAKLNNAEKSLREDLSADLFGLNNHTSDITFEGLKNWIRDVPNPAYASRYTQGGIQQGHASGDVDHVNPWWNNKSKDMVNLDLTLDLTNNMMEMWDSTKNGRDVPKIIVTTDTLRRIYEQETMEYVTIINQKEGDATFGSVKFKGAPVIDDTECGNFRMYFLNTDYLYLILDQDVNFQMTPWKDAQKDLDRVCQIIVAGNLGCSNRSRQGVLYNAGGTST